MPRVSASGDLVPVELHAGADDEIVVGQGIAVVEVNRVLLGLKSLGRIANPLDADRYQAFFRAARAGQRIDAGANQRT